jgi:hypothetical protein
VWGEQKDASTASVTVEDEDGKDIGTITITENLNAALPYLRFRRQPRTLWIDTICIDQTNLAEKGHSVARMAEVYNYAARVIIWLGVEANSSTNAMKAMRWLGEQVIVNWKQRSLLLASEATQEELDDLIQRDMDIFLSLLERPWFERLWVQQEAKLAQHAQVVCGAKSLDWQVFRNALFCLWHFSQRRALPGHVVEHMNKFYILIAKTSFLLNELIFHGRQRKCTDPRDRVYSLLGLIGGRERKLGIEPDYTKTPGQVYKDVITSYLKNLNRLDPISCCEGPDDVTTRGIPSWVPDWERSRKSAPFHFKRHPPTFDTQAYIEDERVLCAKGVRVATVEHVFPIVMPPQASPQEIVDHIIAIAPRDLWDASPDKEEIINIFCRTIIADHFRERWNPADSQEAIESEGRELIRAIISGQYSEEKYLASIPTATRYLTLVRLYAAHRSFLLTSDGRFVLGPESAMVGSVIVSILGCKTPLALNPGKGDEYTVAGECYLDSAVAGQPLLGLLPENFVNVTSYDPQEDMFVHSFLDRLTGKFQREEPRLVPKLGEGYRAGFMDLEALRNTESEAALEVLHERDVKLEEFRIV